MKHYNSYSGTQGYRFEIGSYTLNACHFFMQTAYIKHVTIHPSASFRLRSEELRRTGRADGLAPRRGKRQAPTYPYQIACNNGGEMPLFANQHGILLTLMPTLEWI